MKADKDAVATADIRIPRPFSAARFELALMRSTVCITGRGKATQMTNLVTSSSGAKPSTGKHIADACIWTHMHGLFALAVPLPLDKFKLNASVNSVARNSLCSCSCL